MGSSIRTPALYAAWGVDYLKVDWCFSDGLDAAQQYRLWSDAIAATGRPMLLSICEWGENNAGCLGTIDRAHGAYIAGYPPRVGQHLG